jgi:hypothetical protein
VRNNKYVRRDPEEEEVESAAVTGYAVTHAVSREKAVSSSRSKRAGSTETVRIISSARATAVPFYYFAPVDLSQGWQAVEIPAEDVQAGNAAESGAPREYGAGHEDPRRLPRARGSHDQRSERGSSNTAPHRSSPGRLPHGESAEEEGAG